MMIEPRRFIWIFLWKWAAQRKGNYINNKKDGIYESYLADGNLILKGVYKEGLRNGLIETTYKNSGGKIKEKAVYSNDTLMVHMNHIF